MNGLKNEKMIFHITKNDLLNNITTPRFIIEFVLHLLLIPYTLFLSFNKTTFSFRVARSNIANSSFRCFNRNNGCVI